MFQAPVDQHRADMDERRYSKRKAAAGRTFTPATAVLLLAVTALLHWAGLVQGMATASHLSPSVATAPDLAPDPPTSHQIIDLRELVRLGLIETRLPKAKPAPQLSDGDDPVGLDPQGARLQPAGRHVVALPPADGTGSLSDADFAARAPPAFPS